MWGSLGSRSGARARQRSEVGAGGSWCVASFFFVGASDDHRMYYESADWLVGAGLRGPGSRSWELIGREASSCNDCHNSVRRGLGTIYMGSSMKNAVMSRFCRVGFLGYLDYINICSISA